LLAQLLRDEAFFRRSGGGVTVTGGEPLSQAAFVGELGRRLVELGIEMIIDTCGFGAWSAVETVLPYTKNFLYDIKHVDSEKHQRATAFDNRLILQNCRRLANRNIPLTIRIPLIPGVNSEDEDLAQILRFLRSISSLQAVEIVPYHELGVPKYRRLEKEYQRPERTLDVGRVHSVIAFFEKEGLPCRRAF
jgi:pyruvate formate lyase activating enzyme